LTAPSDSRGVCAVATGRRCHPEVMRAGTTRTRSRRRPRLSTDRRRQLKRQGEYIGSMRGLPVGRKARVKREREERGIEAAIQLARKLAKA
jgi:hypothetical protein